MKTYNLLVVTIIFVVALILRLFGLNWDQDQHLHPDERFLTMVVSDIRLPSSLAEYFNTHTSPLNPYNNPNYQFFVYGTFPIFLVKLVSELIGQSGYHQVHLVGRIISAVFDSINIILLYLIALKINFPKKHLYYVPSVLYAFTVLPIQLSHFFAVDTYLATSLLATFTLLLYRHFSLSAIFFGLALSSKITAVYFIPVIGIFYLSQLIRTKEIVKSIFSAVLFIVLAFTTYRIFQPYAFTGIATPNPQFIDNINTLKSFASPSGLYPPSVQWLSKTPLLYSLQNLVLFGLGVPLSIFFLLGLFNLNSCIKQQAFSFSLIWILLLFFIQGSQFAHTMRYFLPIYPFICILSSVALQKSKPAIVWLFFATHLFSGLAFTSIYHRPHSRVQASEWIYNNLPGGSRITNEYWDDPLPLYLPGYNPNIYDGKMLPLYDPDSSEKWDTVNTDLNNTDYIIMSSNRLWGSIPLVPEQYPTTSKFYRDLFDEKLPFTKLKEIVSYPGVSLPFLKHCYYFGPTNYPGLNTNGLFEIDPQCAYPGVYLRDDIAEEAFTVYDHPKVLIYQRKN